MSLPPAIYIAALVSLVVAVLLVITKRWHNQTSHPLTAWFGQMLSGRQAAFGRFFHVLGELRQVR